MDTVLAAKFNFTHGCHENRACRLPWGHGPCPLVTCLVWFPGFVLIPDNLGVFHLEGYQLVGTWDGRLGVCLEAAVESLEAAVESGELPSPGGWAARGSPGGGGRNRRGPGMRGGCAGRAKRLTDPFRPARSCPSALPHPHTWLHPDGSQRLCLLGVVVVASPHCPQA